MVAEDFRDMTELLTALLGAIVGVVVAYPLGKRQAREQTLYEERARTVAEIRHRLRELQAKIYEWSIPYESEYRVDSYPNRLVQGRDIFQQVENLRTYYVAQEPWLGSRTRETFSEVEGQLLKVCFNFVEIIDSDDSPNKLDLATHQAAEEEHAAILNEWIAESNREGYGKLKDKWDREVERIVGSRSRWRRIFS